MFEKSNELNRNNSFKRIFLFLVSVYFVRFTSLQIKKNRYVGKNFYSFIIVTREEFLFKYVCKL